MLDDQHDTIIKMKLEIQEQSQDNMKTRQECSETIGSMEEELDKYIERCEYLQDKVLNKREQIKELELAAKSYIKYLKN